MTASVRRSLLVLVVLTGAAATAWAQTQVGVRAGLSADPDQFVFGGHVESQPIASRTTFRPNLEIGVGNHVAVITANIEFVYSIPLTRHPWRLYLGGGPAAVITSGGNGRGDDDVGGGFNVLVGAQRRTGLFGELKVGLADSPELKVMVGYAFR